MWRTLSGTPPVFPQPVSLTKWCKRRSAGEYDSLARKFFTPPIALQGGAGILGTVADRARSTASRGVPHQKLHARRFLSA